MTGVEWALEFVLHLLFLHAFFNPLGGCDNKDRFLESGQRLELSV
jgi:hypothetical protein